MRIIQVRPSRNPRWKKQGGWEVFEGDGVSPVFCGDNGRESALSSFLICMRTIQVRPSRDPRWRKQRGWEAFEGDGVSSVFCGDNGRESALSYARQRAGYGPCEIQVLGDEWTVAEIIGNEDSRPLV